MAVGRTADLEVLIDSGAELFTMRDILGLTVEGATTTSRQAHLGEVYEAAMVHAAGGGIGIDTLYQTTEFEAFATSAPLTPDDGNDVLLLAAKAPTSWHLVPCTWARPGYDAPPDDAITRSWALKRRDIGYAGTLVTPFSVTGTDKTVLVKDFDDSNGNVGVVVITDWTGATGVTLSGRSGLPVYTEDAAKRAGIRRFVLATGDPADLSIQLAGSSSAAVTGFVLQGNQEVLPNG